MVEKNVGTVEAGCLGKEKYDSRLRAEEVAKRRNKRGQHLHVYRCKFCHSFHVGTARK